MNRLAHLLAAVTTLCAVPSAAHAAGDPGASLIVTNYFLQKNFTRGSELQVKVALGSPSNVAFGDKIAVWDPATKKVWASAALSQPVFSIMNVKLTLADAAMAGPTLELAYLRNNFTSNTVLATGQELKVVLDPVSEQLVTTTVGLGTNLTSLFAQSTQTVARTALLENLVAMMQQLAKDRDAAHTATEQSLADKAAKLAEQNAAIDAGLAEALAKASAAMEAAWESMAIGLVSADASIASIGTEVTYTKGKLFEALGRLDQLRDTLATADVKLENTRAHIDALQAELDALHTKVVASRESYVGDAVVNTGGCAPTAATAYCDEGDVAVSGGCDLGEGDEWSLTRNAPVSDEAGHPVGWTCRMRADSATCSGGTLKAEVVCAPR